MCVLFVFEYSLFFLKNEGQMVIKNHPSRCIFSTLCFWHPQLSIINFRINPEDKKIKEYYLTDRGIDLYDIIYELQSWTIDNVDFNHSKNTEEFIKLNQSKSKKVIISNNKKKYRKLRLEKFGK